MKKNHSNIREEQFWFTAAVVGFNTLIISKDADVLDAWFLIVASALVSIFGVHLILTRWLAASGRSKADSDFDHKKATTCQRARLTGVEIRSYVCDLPYVLAELSGTLFYLLLIFVTFIGVVYKVL